VAGDLPIAELAAAGDKLLYLRADLDVSEPGEVEVKIDSGGEISAWVDSQALGPSKPWTASLDKGLHHLVLCVKLTGRPDQTLRALVEKPAGSTVSYSIVGGK
jgi:hypothetical protein